LAQVWCFVVRNSLDLDLFKILSMPVQLKFVLTTCTMAAVGQAVRDVIRRRKQDDLSKASVNNAEAVITSIINPFKVDLLFFSELASSNQTDDASPPLTCQEAVNSYFLNFSRQSDQCGDLQCQCELALPLNATFARALQADQECAVEQPNVNREWMEQFLLRVGLVCGDESHLPSPLFETCITPYRRFLDIRWQTQQACLGSVDYAACSLDSFCPRLSIVMPAYEAFASEECRAIWEPVDGAVSILAAMKEACNATASA